MHIYYCVLENIRIQNANSIGGILTYGFPAITAFTGLYHNLSRKFKEENILFSGVLIACNAYDLQAHQATPYADKFFNQMRKPLLRTGKVAGIVEEGRVHLDISLIFELKVPENLAHRLSIPERAEEYSQKIKNSLLRQRIAGGSVLEIGSSNILSSEKTTQALRSLLPGSVLLDAGAELVAITKELQTGIKHEVSVRGAIEPVYDEDEEEVVLTGEDANPSATTLDALVAVATLDHEPPSDTKDTWSVRSIKTGRGWLVPIAIGYQGLSDSFKPGELKHTRSEQYPSQFVETVYSLGKWVFPLRLSEQNISHYFWRFSQSQDNFYLSSQFKK